MVRVTVTVLSLICASYLYPPLRDDVFDGRNCDDSLAELAAHAGIFTASSYTDPPPITYTLSTVARHFKNLDQFWCWVLWHEYAQACLMVRNKLDYAEVLEKLKTKGIAIRVASPKLVMEEAPESYKDVTEVVNTCHDAGISKKAVKLRPIAVVKG